MQCDMFSPDEEPEPSSAAVQVNTDSGTPLSAAPGNVVHLTIYAVDGNMDTTMLTVAPGESPAIISDLPEAFTGIIRVTGYDEAGVALCNGSLPGVTIQGKDIPVDVTCNLLIPQAPGLLIVSGLSHRAVSLSWSDNSRNEDGFLLVRNSLTGTDSLPAAANAISFTDTAVVPGETCVYILKAVNPAGESPAESLSVTVPHITLTGTARLEDLPGTEQITISLFDNSGLLLDSFTTASGTPFVRTPFYRNSVLLTASCPGFEQDSAAVAEPLNDTLALADVLILPDTTPPVITNLDGAISHQLGTALSFTASATDPPYAEVPALEWDFTGDGNFAAVASTCDHFYTDTGSFTATVRATDTHGNSSTDYRMVTILPPRAEIMDTTETTVSMNWSKVDIAYLTSYQVYDMAGNIMIKESNAANDTAFTVAGLYPATSYSFLVVWYYTGGSQSTVLTATTETRKPCVLSLDSVNTNSVSLSWTPYAGEGFQAYRVMSNVPGISGTYTLQDTEITDAGLTAIKVTGL